ncbi:hypothetical protein ACWEJ6_12395 [Nonomuraea sp. NPDC004702]
MTAKIAVATRGSVSTMSLRRPCCLIVLVRAEESWDGDPIRADAEGMAAAPDASLTAWLARPKRTAENA